MDSQILFHYSLNNLFLIHTFKNKFLPYIITAASLESILDN